MKIVIDSTVSPPKEIIVIDDSDVWDMDITLSTIIYPMLVKYKEVSTLGWPGTFDSEKFTEEENRKRWEDVLDAMTYAFKEYPTYQMYLDVDKDIKIKTGIDLFAKYFYNLWD